MVTVKVVHKSTGKPASFQKVSLEVADGFTSTHRTDDSGEAHFDLEPKNGKVYVGGSEAHSGFLRGRILVYI